MQQGVPAAAMSAGRPSAVVEVELAARQAFAAEIRMAVPVAELLGQAAAAAVPLVVVGLVREVRLQVLPPPRGLVMQVLVAEMPVQLAGQRQAEEE